MPKVLISGTRSKSYLGMLSKAIPYTALVLVYATAAYSDCTLVHQDPSHYKLKDGSVDYVAISKEVDKNGVDVTGYLSNNTPDGYRTIDPATLQTYNYTKGCPEDINKFLDAKSLCIHYGGEINGDGSENDAWIQKQAIEECGDAFLCRGKTVLSKYKGTNAYDTLIAALKIIDGNDYEMYMNEMEKVKCPKS